MTDDANRAGDAGPQAESAVDSTVSDGIPDAQPRRRRRKTRRIRKDQIDITKVLLAPVRLLQGARTRQISAFEATLRAQVTKAIEGKDSASIKALIDFAIQYDLVAPPAPAVRSCGVFVVPKCLSEADQREIFDPDTTSMNRIMAKAVGRPVDVHAYADRIVIKQDGIVVGEHPRRFGSGQVIYDPWHYVPVLARKPGALRNGAPFKDWVLPASLERVRRKLKGSDDGDRQMVKILTAVLTDDLVAVEAACAEALDAGLASADVILNALARRQQATPPSLIFTPERLTLTVPPLADCARYDRLRATEARHGAL